MYDTSRLIYDFREHGLYYQNSMDDSKVKKITLTIDTLQLEFNYITGELLTVTGYFPLFNACRIPLEIPLCIEKKFTVKLENVEYIPGMAYDYFKFYPESKIYFIKDDFPIIFYDEENRRILIGNMNALNADNMKLNKNIICALDEKRNLKSMLLLLDEVIKE